MRMKMIGDGTYMKVARLDNPKNNAAAIGARRHEATDGGTKSLASVFYITGSKATSGATG